MIAGLAGTLIEKSSDRIVVDVHGVAYAVLVSLQTFTALPATGSAVRLLVHTEVREDAIELIGFVDEAQRALFHLLRKVKGLGPRTSLVVLSGMPARELAAVIAAGDAGRLQAIPGVGKKLAERVVVECRAGAALLAGGHGPTTAPAANGDGLVDEAVSALVNLGYKRPEAERAVTRARTDGAALEQRGASLEEVIRAALRGLSG
jgi:Holliday junction DNA helicase RuvA